MNISLTVENDGRCLYSTADYAMYYSMGFTHTKGFYPSNIVMS